MTQLRPYQQAAVDAVYEHLRTRDDNPAVVLPTAGGKSWVIAQLVKDAVLRWNGRVLVLAHVKELLEQNAEKICRLCPEVPIGIYSAGLNRRETDKPVIVAGIQSIYKRACELDAFDLVIVDEAHLIPPDGEGMYRTFLAEAKVVNPHLRVIGLTATPFRLASGPICTPDGILNHICYEVGVRELIRDGYLCPLVTKAGINKADFERLHVRGGEFVADEVEALMDADNLVIAACSEIVAHTHNRQSVLVFTSGVKHGKHVARVLAEMSGQEVGFIDGNTPGDQRAELIARFRRQTDGMLLPCKPLKYLVNVNVLTTGFDAPNIDCVAILRPTMSPGLWYQMCLDMETEVMTPQGWAKCSQVNVGDSVGAFDLATGEIVFCPALDKVHRPLAPGETMYGVSAPHLDIRVTDRHTMVYRGRGETCRHWRKRDARALAALRDSFLVPVAGNTDGPSVPLSDDELRFLGWVLTDGYRDPSNNAVVISQSAAGPYLEQIHSMLKGCGIGYRVYRRERKGKLSQYPPAVQFQIPYGEPRGANQGLRGWKHLADYLNRPLLESLLPISRRQLQVLLEAMNLGDGAKRKSVSWRPRTMDICLGEHQFLAEQLQVLCVLRGFRCNISILRQRSPWHSGDPKPLYVLRVREQQVATIGGSVQRRNPLVKKRSRFGPVPFDPSEMVWCLTTEYGTLVTRRRGKVCIVGNCGRGFRLHPGKQDCLVLDFGGNALRHGPVDQLRIPHAPGGGTGQAPAKDCPDCHAVIAAGYATCPECGHQFPPPERQKHEARASTAGVLSGQFTDTEYEVLDIRYSVHTKRDAPLDAPRSMRVEYRIGQFTWVSEWVCFEHTGYARWKAEQWWKKRSPDPVPDTAERAVEIAEAGGVAVAERIVVRSVAGEKYDRIVGYTLGPMPEPVPDGPSEYDLGDVPF